MKELLLFINGIKPGEKDANEINYCLDLMRLVAYTPADYALLYRQTGYWLVEQGQMGRALLYLQKSKEFGGDGSKADAEMQYIFNNSTIKEPLSEEDLTVISLGEKTFGIGLHTLGLVCSDWRMVCLQSRNTFRKTQLSLIGIHMA